MQVLFIFLLGLVVGIAVKTLMFHFNVSGLLKVDDSDPFEQPYLFLELSRHIDKVCNSHYVSFRVTKENMLERRKPDNVTQE